MASRRARNPKTHPKPNGDDAQDDYMPPDRVDQNTNQDDSRTEVVNVFGDKQTVEVGGGEVDLNSATEGDGRTMASEGSGDDGVDNDAGDRSRPAARPARGAQPAARGRGGDDQGDEEGGYSARVRKRISRERALVNRERTLREQTQRELATERAARQAQDERIARLERAQTDVAGNASVKELEAKIEALKPQLAAAIESGDTAKQLDIQDKIADLKGDLKVLKYDLQKKQEAAQGQQQGARTAAAVDTTSVVDDPRVAELAVQFQRANRHWWNRTANKEARADCITIDKEILQDIQAGDLDFEPYSDEHFEEMARRLHETYPDLEIQDLDGQPYNFDEEEDMNTPDGRNGRQQTGGNGTRGSGRGQAPIARRGSNGRQAPSDLELARQGKVELNADDFKTMRTFKMDPNNPNDKKYFAREKMRSILTGTRQQGDR